MRSCRTAEGPRPPPSGFPWRRSSVSLGRASSALTLSHPAMLLLAAARSVTSPNAPPPGIEIDSSLFLFRISQRRDLKPARGRSSLQSENSLSDKSSTSSCGQASRTGGSPSTPRSEDMPLEAQCRSFSWGRKALRAAMCWKVTPVALTASFVRERNADPYTWAGMPGSAGWSLFPERVSFASFGSCVENAAISSQDLKRLSSSSRHVIPPAFSLSHSSSPAPAMRAAGRVISSSSLVLSMRTYSRSLPTSSHTTSVFFPLGWRIVMLSSALAASSDAYLNTNASWKVRGALITVSARTKLPLPGGH
mmetsp:Transcript_27417/g.63714  ORF Transcript_27417/g.63714 Transcript_27417/m.63714 type:complete len:307 (-) Transcript_27417:274-1194(-)